MASFQAKTGRDRLRVIKTKKLSFRSIPTRPGIGNSKKTAEKCKKLRNIIMALFQGKTGWDRLSVIQKKKIYRSDPFQQDLELRIAKKCKKIKKHHNGFISSQNGTGQAKSDTKKKVIVSIHSNPTRNREFQNDSKEMQKIKNHHYG